MTSNETSTKHVSTIAHVTLTQRMSNTSSNIKDGSKFYLNHLG